MRSAVSSLSAVTPGALHPTLCTFRMIMSDLASLEQRALAELHACADEAALRAWNTRYFGNRARCTRR